ncbi:unnamed protein product [Urochloa decumbens]|uniref:Protein SCAR n=1 Tax=Urochloa decumbens TaxID=240449 RepID=A0ABC9H9V2_9POAL
MAAMRRPGSSGSTPAVNKAALELEGLAMAGLVAVLRHLGDLAELAAEVFDGLQDQAVAVSARARRLKARAKQLQADLDRNGHRPRLCQAQTTRTPTRRQQQQQKVSHGVAGGEAPPRSIVNHIKRCRGPPRLSALDRFDAHGDGACLKRYTNPSFFRAAHSQNQNACSANHLHQADSDDTRSQTDDSEKHSLGFLSMLRRQLKHRQTAGSVSCPSLLKLQTCTHRSSHSDLEMDKADRNHPSATGQSKDSPTSNCCSDAAAAGSDYVGSCSELQRTSSFEAWLSPGPGARFGSADPAVQDSAAVSDDALLKDSHQETTRLQRTGCESYDDDDAPADPEKHDKQNGPSISSQCSNSSSPENSGEHTYTPDAKDVVLLPRTECETDKSLHTKLTSVLPENTYSSKADAPPLLPIPPMQWLSAKVHTGKDHVQRAGGKILKNTELVSVLELTSGWSEPGGTNQLSGAEIRSQFAAADTDRGMEVTDRPTQDLYREGAEVSSCGKANKAQAQVDVQSSGDENVFFSAVEQLARTSPPWIPSRCDRITLRNGPSPLHGSRSILDCRTTLLEQIKDKAHADSNHVHSD